MSEWYRKETPQDAFSRLVGVLKIGFLLGALSWVFMGGCGYCAYRVATSSPEEVKGEPAPLTFTLTVTSDAPGVRYWVKFREERSTITTDTLDAGESVELPKNQDGESFSVYYQYNHRYNTYRKVVAIPLNGESVITIPELGQ